jgi:hypothetical protein
MIDPPRLLDAGDDAPEVALLRVGKHYRLDEGARRRALGALGLGAGSTALLSSTATAATAAGWPLKAIIVVGLVGGLAGGALAVKRAPVSNALVAPVAQPAVPAEAKAAPTVDAIQSAERSVVQEPAQTATHSVASSSDKRKAARAGAPTLTEELAALDAARAALRGGDVQGSLSLLDHYSQSFPKGNLALEAQVLRIEALAKSGNSQAASTLAKAFLAHHANSLLASRVRRFVDNAQ